MKGHGILTLFFILCVGFSAQAQYWLDTVEIKGDRPFYNSTLKADASYSDSLYRNVTQFLQHIQGGQVQISTPGGLTTLLHRGMGSRHLPILWQGFNLQNTINGSFDLALIPGFLFSEINFYNHGNPTLTGNNGLAGALSIHNASTNQESSKAFIRLSSLQNYEAGLVLAGKSDKLKYKLGVQSAYQLNRYSYEFNLQKHDRQSTDFLQNNVLFNTSYLINNRQSIHADIWWQLADRIIPTSVTSSNTLQQQKDQNFRSSLVYKYYTTQSIWHISSMYGHEILNFFAPAVDSRAKTGIYTIQAGWTELHHLKMNVQLQHRTDIANPNFFTKSHQRNTTSASVFKHLDWTDSFNTEVSLRQDFVDEQFKPFSWTLTNQFNSLTWIISSNYNLPGFNDLYWPSGGNPDLKTEQTYKTELKYSFAIHDLNIQSSIYANHVNDWIQWLPQANGLWSPINQKKVLARGLELTLGKAVNLAKSHVHLEAKYALNRTTALSHYSDPTLEGKQLIYIPMHQGSMQATFHIKQSKFSLQYHWTGNRYDQPDETGILKPVHLMHFNYSLQLKQHRFHIDIQNLLNQNYTWVRFYPMPRIHAAITYLYQL
ncbi:MAG: TonB-dependent receptor [Chitinophagales bacterium]|nr:TonB-dependent receptor [Chitinophagales bacterium]